MNPGQASNGKVPAARLWLAVLLLAPDARAGQPDRPVRIDVAYTGEIWRNLAGGIDTGSVYLDNLDITAAIDADALWDWSGTSVFLSGLYNNGHSLSGNRTGDLQAASNIESAVHGFRIYEAWVDTSFGESGSLRLGLYDLNSEFDVLESAALFLHSAHGIGTDIGQTGRNGPSIFPITSLAVRFAWSWWDTWSLRGAALDAVPGDPDDPGENDIDISADEGALLVAEVERYTRRSKLLLGVWGYTAEFETWSQPQPFQRSPRSHGNKGGYVRAEARLNGELTVFGRYGRAAGRFNAISDFFSAGLRWQGPLPGRPADQLGAAIAWAEASSHYRDAGPLPGEDVEPWEAALELTYRMPLGNRLVLQPDLQYIRNPGLNASLDDVFAVGLRVELELL